MSIPWMPLYIADYLRDTSHLRALESGAYMHLIMAYWANGKLPDNDRQLATIAKVTDEEWAAIRETIFAFFGPGWTNKRIDKELAEAEAKIAKKSKAGKAGGEASAASRSSNRLTVASADVQAEAKQTSTQPQPQPPIKNIGGADARRPVKKNRRRATQLPDGLTVDYGLAGSAGLTRAEAEREFTKFRNHAKEKGRTCIDWRAAWHNWCLKAADFMGRKPQPDQSAGPTIPSDLAVKLYREAERWNVAYGPEPGKPGCRAPKEILDKYGFTEAA